MINVLLMIDEASLGGGQKHVLWLAQKLDRRRFNVAVACEEKGWLVDELRRNGITHYPINISNRPNPVSLLKIRRLIKRESPLILHTQGGTAGFYGRLAGYGVRGVKTVHTYHGIHYLNHEMSLTKRVFKFIDSLFLGLTDRVICVAESDLEAGLAAGVVDRNKTEVIYNGIEIREYEEGIKQSRGGAFTVGSIGRLHIQKGYTYLIDAAVKLVRKYPEMKFVVVGEGEKREELENRIRENRLEANFVLAGSRENVNEELSKMDIFVLPSLWEGLPIVLLEAMAAKKAIVATRVNGTVEIISDGLDGLLISPENAKDIEEKTEILINDCNLRSKLAEQAYTRVEEVFSIESCVKKTEKVYEGVWGIRDNV